jgi:hypothetical protein
VPFPKPMISPHPPPAHCARARGGVRPMKDTLFSQRTRERWQSAQRVPFVRCKLVESTDERGDKRQEQQEMAKATFVRTFFCSIKKLFLY